MEIRSLSVGQAQSNCYIVVHPETKESIIIDPGENPDRIQAVLRESESQPLAILLTHTHFDHIGAVDAIRSAYEIPVYVGEEEADWLTDPNKNLSSLSGNPIHAKAAEHTFNVGEILRIGSFAIKVVPTPGHSPGSVSFIFEEEKFVVSGDALFAGSIGRTDLPGSNHTQLFESIETQLFTLPTDFRVYPGHGESTTIGHEKETNPFFA